MKKQPKKQDGRIRSGRPKIDEGEKKIHINLYIKKNKVLKFAGLSKDGSIEDAKKHAQIRLAELCE